MTAAATLPPPSSAPQAGPAPDEVISVRELTKVFDEQTALDAVSLSVPAGVILGVIGPSGCGKTTLIRQLTGIAAPTSGEVRVFGADPTKFTVRQRNRFGYMPQLPVLFPNLTIWANLNFIASVYGMPVRRRKQRLLTLLDLVDLREHRRKQLADCSGGMQRRLTLAATLVHDPELLYLDEPTAGVDPILRERFWGHFRSLREEGRTIVVPTQYVNEAVSCDYVAVMARGQILTVRPPGELTRFAYGGEPLLVQFSASWASPADVARLRALPFVQSVDRAEEGLIVVVDDVDEGQRLLQEHAASIGTEPEISVYEPNPDQMFVKIVEAHAPAAVGAT